MARLKRIPGISEATVECTGTFFCLQLDDASGAEAAIDAALDVLGGSARRLPDAAADAQLDARVRGDLWFSERQIRGLSYVEGRVLASRVVAALGAEVAMASDEVELVAEQLRAELFATLDRVHDEGGRRSSAWLAEAWPQVTAGVAERLAGTRPATWCAAVVQRLARLRPQA